MQRSVCPSLLCCLLLLPLLLTGCPDYIPGIDHSCLCNWPASAFEDPNGNGIRDAGEPPIENVRLLVDMAAAPHFTPGKTIHGTALEPINIAPYGFGWCPSAIEVTATPPKGYTPTTPVKAKIEGEPKEGVAFGFKWTGGERPARPAVALSRRR